MVLPKKSQQDIQITDNDDTLVSSEDKEETEPVTTPKSTPRQPRKSTSGSIKSTPLNKRERGKRRRSSFCRNFNVTNLNVLFESSFINQGTSPCDDKKGAESPKSDESTQTLNFGESQLITETPKLSQHELIEEVLSQLRSPKGAPTQSKIHYLDTNVNLNPYVSNSDVKFITKEPSLGEISFFTPHLYNLKKASTPIDKIAENFLKTSPIRESPLNVKNNNVDNVKIDKISNFAYQSTPLITPKTDSPLLNTQNREKNVSAKSNRSKNFTIVHNLSRISKTNSGYRTFALDQQDKGGVEVLFQKFRRLSRTSVRWSYKIVDLCNYIGLAVRKVRPFFLQTTQNIL